MVLRLGRSPCVIKPSKAARDVSQREGGIPVKSVAADYFYESLSVKGSRTNITLLYKGLKFFKPLYFHI